MARSLTPGAEKLYRIQARWLAEVLSSHGSLLKPEQRIWTVERLDELEAHFVGNPDTSKDKNFLEKLHGQLSRVSPEAVQLMAEVHVVHFLIIANSAMSVAKKRSDVEAILSWMPAPISVPREIDEAFAPGLVHPGQWMLTRRDLHITWLVRFARRWLDETEERRRAMLADPWAMRSFAETVHSTKSTDGARLALLHLAHPDTFEAIVSPGHRALIVERYSELTSGDDDVDRQLLEVRAALARTYGNEFRWYHEPVLRQWFRDKKWSKLLGWLKRFRADPGFEDDERTYKIGLAERVNEARELVRSDAEEWADAVRRAVGDKNNNLTGWRSHSAFLEWIDSDHAGAAKAVRALWAGEGTPETRLRAFLEAVPAGVLGPLGARLNIGTFLLMAEDVYSLPPAKISGFRKAWDLAGWGRELEGLDVAGVYQRILVFLDELVRDSRAWEVPLRDRLDAQGAVWALTKRKDNPANWPKDEWAEFSEWREGEVKEEEEEEGPEEVGAGSPASGEDGGVDEVDHLESAARALHVDRAVVDEIVELLEDKRQVVLYGPPGTGKTYFALRLAKALAQGDGERIRTVQFHPATTYEDFFEGLRPRVTDAGQVTYVRTDGPLADIAAAAAADPDRRYILVIDEINRANLPKVFGELLLLLEYRTEPVRTLYRPREAFRLPDNLWFIGTMNTADRSVALIDAAMRRRFHFVPFFPHSGPMEGLLRRWLNAGAGRIGVADFLDAVNGELITLVGEHLLIGPSHFMKTDLSDRALERTWTYNVFPLIEEQLWGNVEEIDRWRWANVRARFASTLSSTRDDVADGDS